MEYGVQVSCAYWEVKKRSRSLELGNSVDVTLEGSVVDVGAVIVDVRHGWLVLRAIPLNVAGKSVSVAVDVLVVLMVSGVLTHSPLTMSIGNGRILGEDASECPVEEIWVVDKGLGVEGMIVHHKRAVVTETTTNTSDQEVAHPTVCEPATNVEVLDGELTDDGKSKNDTSLSTSGIVGPVPVRLISWTGDHGEITTGEPALKNVEIVHSLGSPLELTLLKNVL